MSTAAERKHETETIRVLVALFPARDVRLIAAACSLRAVVLSQIDGQYPDPALRSDVVELGRLEHLFSRANQAREEIVERQAPI